MDKKIVKVIGSDPLVIQMFNKHPKYKAYGQIASPPPDLVCFIGGADIHPKLYDEDPLDNVYPNDKLDMRDIQAWHDHEALPKVGICRGGQLLNVLSGGSLWQDVKGHMVSHGAVNLVPDMKPWDVGTRLTVTSDHHQVMIPGQGAEVLLLSQAPGLVNKPFGYNHRSKKPKPVPTYDVEGVFYEHTNSLCFQPHPEYYSLSDCERYFFGLLERIYWQGE